MSPADGPGGLPWDPFVISRGLAVYRIGEGDPVLFMPGPHRMQRVGTRSGDALIGGLRELGRSVLTFDPPGSGRSSRPARLSMDEMHECAEETLFVLGVENPVAVAGHSMGGLAALAFAISRPDRVLRLLLIGTGSGGEAYMQAPGALWNRSHPRFPTLVALGLLQTVWPRRGPEQIMMNFIERESHTGARGGLDSTSPGQNRLASGRSPARLPAAAGRDRGTGALDVWTPRSAVPTLVLGGTGVGHPPISPCRIRAERPLSIHRRRATLLVGSGSIPVRTGVKPAAFEPSKPMLPPDRQSGSNRAAALKLCGRESCLRL